MKHGLLLDRQASSWYKRNGHDLKTLNLNLGPHLHQVPKGHLQHCGHCQETHTTNSSVVSHPRKPDETICKP